MPSFKSIDEMKKGINELITKAMDKVGNTALEKMIKYVEEEMKDESDNELYVRTNQFLHSISKLDAKLNIDGSITTYIFYDTDKIEPFTIANPPVDSDQTWGWHSDFSGQSVVDLIPLWLDITGTPNNPYYQHEPIKGLEYLEEWVKKNLKRELKKELIKLGLKVY